MATSQITSASNVPEWIAHSRKPIPIERHSFASRLVLFRIQRSRIRKRKLVFNGNWLAVNEQMRNTVRAIQIRKTQESVRLKPTLNSMSFNPENTNYPQILKWRIPSQLYFYGSHLINLPTWFSISAKYQSLFNCAQLDLITLTINNSQNIDPFCLNHDTPSVFLATSSVMRNSFN